MTIEAYLDGVKRIYYQLSVLVEGKQLLADGNNLLLEAEVSRLTDLRDGRHRLSKVRFANLSIPAATEIDELGRDYVIINFGNARLVIWPKEVE